MDKLLFIVEDVFTIFGRGIVLLPGMTKGAIPPDMRPNGSTIELRRPDGSVVATLTQAIIGFQTPPAPDAPILLPPEIRKEDVPIGTEVWLRG